MGDKLLEERYFLNTDFGFQADDAPAGRLYNPALTDGSLPDAGIYPVSLAIHDLWSPGKNHEYGSPRRDRGR